MKVVAFQLSEHDTLLPLSWWWGNLRCNPKCLRAGKGPGTLEAIPQPPLESTPFLDR